MNTASIKQEALKQEIGQALRAAFEELLKELKEKELKQGGQK
jgi:hypothetical protein